MLLINFEKSLKYHVQVILDLYRNWMELSDEVQCSRKCHQKNKINSNKQKKTSLKNL